MPVAPVVVTGVNHAPDVERAHPGGAPISDASGGVFATALARAAGRVEPAHTPLGGEQAASALSDAYRTVTGRAPTAKQLSLLVAQWSLETGGGRAMMNNNFGGIKGRSPAGLSTSYTTKEGFGPTERVTVDAFRAYRTPEEGAKDYVRTLRARFPKSFAAVATGDAQAFARTLKREGYYTGSEADYTRAIASISERALSKGFASAGQPGGERRAVAVAPEPQEKEGFGALEALDALRMADEMSRAAMQIAAGDGRFKGGMGT